MGFIQRVKVKIANYGIYHVIGSSEYIEEVVESPMYFAPECLLVNAGERKFTYSSDIWAFGILLIELFTGWKMSETWNGKQVLSVISSIVFKSMFT